MAEMTQSYAAMGPSVADPSTGGLTDKLAATSQSQLSPLPPQPRHPDHRRFSSGQRTCVSSASGKESTQILGPDEHHSGLRDDGCATCGTVGRAWRNPGGEKKGESAEARAGRERPRAPPWPRQRRSLRNDCHPLQFFQYRPKWSSYRAGATSQSHGQNGWRRTRRLPPCSLRKGLHCPRCGGSRPRRWPRFCCTFPP